MRVKDVGSTMERSMDCICYARGSHVLAVEDEGVGEGLHVA